MKIDVPCTVCRGTGRVNNNQQYCPSCVMNQREPVMTREVHPDEEIVRQLIALNSTLSAITDWARTLSTRGATHD